MSVQDRINDYWTERAPAYDDYQQRPERAEIDRREWADIWTSVLAGAPGDVLDVLDVGTGSGHAARVIAGLGHRTTGIDLAEGMLERARAHAETMDAPPRFLVGDAVAPDFPDGSFDAITGRYLLWTLRHPSTALDAWWRLLRPGGLVAMVDSTWFPDGLEAAGDHFVAAYDAEVRDALPLAAATSMERSAEVVAAAGFTDVTLTPLPSVLELDRAHGVAPGHDVQMQYVVTGRRA